MTIEATHLINTFSENLKFLNGRKVGLDIDAVTQATFILALKGVSQKFKKIIPKEALTTYWKLAEIGMENGIPEAEALNFARESWNRHDVYLNAPPMPGIKTLLELFDATHTPYVFISSRPIEFLDTTREWFRNTFPQVNPENIILGRKEGTTGGEFKSKMVKEHNVGFHIEDAPEEALVIAEAGTHVLLVPQPWNVQERPNHPLIKHLGDYSDIAGTWPAVRFLRSKEAKEFFASVAQY